MRIALQSRYQLNEVGEDGMMKPVLMAAMLTCAITATPLLAQNSAVTVKAVKDKMVCRSQAKRGSRIAESLCLRASEWAQVDAQKELEAQKFVDDNNRLRGVDPPTSSEAMRAATLVSNPSGQSGITGP